MNFRPVFLILLTFLFLSSRTVFSQKAEAKKPAPAAAPAKDEKDEKDTKAEGLHKVKKEPLVLRASLDGYVSLSNERPLSVDSLTWGDYEVLTLVKHGKRVKKGEVLVSFDRKSYDRALASMERQVATSEKSLAIAKAGLEQARKSSVLDAEAVKRSRDVAAEERRYFRETKRPMDERAAFQSLKSSRQGLAYAEEELKQLLAMYEADDLVEETEEIIIQRAKYGVESAKFRLEGAELQYRRTLDVRLPRESQGKDEVLDRAEIALAEAKTTGPAGLEIKEISFGSKRIAHEQLVEKLADLRKDGGTFQIKSPVDGVVVWGKADGGRWTSFADLSRKFRVHAKVMRHEVLFTVLSGAPAQLTASAKPEHLPLLSKGAKALVSLPGRSEVVVGTVSEIAAAPSLDGTFRVVLKAALPKDCPPGIKASIKAPAKANGGEALTVPSAAVGIDFKDGKVVRFVTMKDKSKRPVELGATVGGKIEIKSGLQAGEEILAKQP